MPEGGLGSPLLREYEFLCITIYKRKYYTSDSKVVCSVAKILDRAIRLVKVNWERNDGMDKQKKNKHFDSRKDLITWLIGVAIWIGISGAVLYMGIKDEDTGFILIGAIFLIAILGFILGMIHERLLELFAGITLILVGWVIPLYWKKYILFVVIFILGAIGLLMVLDIIAEVTKLKNLPIVDKFFKLYGAFVRGLFTFYTAEEGTTGGRFHKIVYKLRWLWNNLVKIIIMVSFVIMGFIMVAIGVLAIMSKTIPWGVVCILVGLLFIVSGVRTVIKRGKSNVK